MAKKKILQIMGAGAAVVMLAACGTLLLQESNSNPQMGGKVSKVPVASVTKLSMNQDGTKETDKENGVVLHYKWNGDQPHLYYAKEDTKEETSFPGVPMKDEGNGWYTYTVSDTKKANLVISVPEKDYQTSEFSRDEGEYWYDEQNGWSTTEPDDYTEPAEENVVSEEAKQLASDQNVTVHFPGDWEQASIYYWNVLPNDKEVEWPGETLTRDEDGYYSYTFDSTTKVNFLFTNGSEQTEDFTQKSGEYWYCNGEWTDKKNRRYAGTGRDKETSCYGWTGKWRNSVFCGYKNRFS